MAARKPGDPFWHVELLNSVMCPLGERGMKEDCMHGLEFSSSQIGSAVTQERRTLRSETG